MKQASATSAGAPKAKKPWYRAIEAIRWPFFIASDYHSNHRYIRPHHCARAAAASLRLENIKQ